MSVYEYLLVIEGVKNLVLVFTVGVQRNRKSRDPQKHYSGVIYLYINTRYIFVKHLMSLSLHSWIYTPPEIFVSGFALL